jgi:glycosyltransferase involved in cell wall biosynthesis
MKILHVLNSLSDSGNGIIHVAVDLACAQAKAGHTVMVASGGGQLEGVLYRHRVTHYRLDQQRRPLALMKAVRKYRNLVSSFDPDIVHAHMLTAVVMARVLRWRLRYRLIATVHNEFRRDAIFMGLADRVVAVSDAAAKSLRRRGIPAAKLTVVRNGPLGNPRTAPISSLEPKPLLRPSITCVAGMYQRKGIAELIDAFSALAPTHPNAHLYLVGDGPDRPAFERRAAASGASARIHFEGFQKDPQRYMVTTDIFVLASRREPFGLVIAEAREASCAIVATSVDGLPEATDGGKAGILVPVGQVGALTQAIRKLLDEPDELFAWRKRSRTNLQWLSTERVHADMMSVYKAAFM